MGGSLDQELHIAYSEVRRLKGSFFDYRSREVPRAEAQRNTW
jgi:hypothetical protein